MAVKKTQKRKVPLKYLPKRLTKKDKKTIRSELNKSRKAYKQKKYITRKKVKSYKSKPSKHVANAKRIYDIDSIEPSKKLAERTGCSLDGLERIMKKGQGAYYSSGSRPNQTAHSWGVARLASAISGGKSAIVDYHILKETCSKNSKALKLANKAKRTLRVNKVPKTMD